MDEPVPGTHGMPVQAFVAFFGKLMGLYHYQVKYYPPISLLYELKPSNYEAVQQIAPNFSAQKSKISHRP